MGLLDLLLDWVHNLISCFVNNHSSVLMHFSYLAMLCCEIKKVVTDGVIQFRSLHVYQHFSLVRGHEGVDWVAFSQLFIKVMLMS